VLCGGDREKRMGKEAERNVKRERKETCSYQLLMKYAS
jgi:hypothetical protein